MGKFIKKLCSVVFGVGGLLFLIPVFSPELEIGSKIVSGIIFCVGVFFSLAFWGSTLETEGASSSDDQVSTAVAAIPSGAETDKDRIKRLKRLQRFFTYQKHLTGIPQAKRKARMDIALEDDGVVFYDASTTTKVFTLQWTGLVAVETTDSQASNDEATNNALRVAAYSSNKASLGGALLLEGAMAMMTKTPLIIKFRQNREDEFVSSIIFDTFEHEKIAERLHAVRNELVSAGAVALDKRSKPAPEDDTLLEKIERLAKLRDAGHLSDSEFESQKQRVLTAS
ncbi:SHOCT domain-containing protein [Sinorhizobium meliloti]|uniref:SHOCT domain-containing protein n=1 Tax=Rhizobium meliloti TaxID=382 RepID=UPI003D64E5A5